MLLTPTENDRLLLYLATLLARERLQRGLLLNVPEATAMICHAACETARDGGRLSDAVHAARTALRPEQVLPEVPAVLDEIQVEAVFDDGTKLIVVHQPLGPATPGGPGEILPGPAPHEADRTTDRVRTQVVNTGAAAISVTSHYHFFEANRALAFDRPAAFGRRLDLPTGSYLRFEPHIRTPVSLIPIRGRRQIIGFAGLVDGPLDEPGARDAAVHRARAAGYLDTTDTAFTWPSGTGPAADEKSRV